LPGARLIASLAQIDDSEAFDWFINLAGEPLAKGRWNSERKARFLGSRLDMTNALLQLAARLERKPEVMISGSAIGHYGHQGDEELDEDAGFSDCFSHRLCKSWEDCALQARSLGIRVCLLRIGIVLGRSGGPLAELRRPFDWSLAVQLGHGRQWMSWLHLDDMLRIIVFAANERGLEGPINATAPLPVTNAQFAALFGRIKGTLAHVRLPAFALRLLAGEMAEEILLTGQRVVPRRLLGQGYRFVYSDLQSALEDLA
jgi:hypothetical protein